LENVARSLHEIQNCRATKNRLLLNSRWAFVTAAKLANGSEVYVI
jgi:hypothetical protein